MAKSKTNAKNIRIFLAETQKDQLSCGPQMLKQMAAISN